VFCGESHSTKTKENTMRANTHEQQFPTLTLKELIAHIQGGVVCCVMRDDEEHPIPECAILNDIGWYATSAKAEARKHSDAARTCLAQVLERLLNTRAAEIDEHMANMARIALFYLHWSFQALGDESPASTIRTLLRRAVNHPLIVPHIPHINQQLSGHGVPPIHYATH
jgi:hypothetical protein